MKKLLKKQIFFTALQALMFCGAVMMLISMSLAWFVTGSDKSVDNMCVVTKDFSSEAELTVTYNQQLWETPVHIPDVSALTLLPEDFLTYRIDAIQTNDDILGLNVLLEGLHGDSLPVQKPLGGNYTMLDMYSIAPYDNAAGAFTAFKPVSAYGGAAQGSALIMTARRGAGVPFAPIIFRVAFMPPQEIGYGDINKLQGKTFSFEAVLLTESNG